MFRGRKPTPDAINEARGNPGKRTRKTISLETLPVAGIDAPKHMRAKGRKYWIEVAGWLAESRIVRVSDRNALARYCETLADYVKVTAALDKQGHVYTTESNHGSMQRISPWFMVQERLTKRLQDLEDRFGLAPASRQQILARMAAGTQTSLQLGGTQNNQDQNAGTGAQDAPVMPNDPLDFFNTQSTRH